MFKTPFLVCVIEYAKTILKPSKITLGIKRNHQNNCFGLNLRGNFHENQTRC